MAECAVACCHSLGADAAGVPLPSEGFDDYGADVFMFTHADIHRIYLPTWPQPSDDFRRVITHSQCPRTAPTLQATHDVSLR
ncbi:hypothetical protein M422DRAFT_264570 [Sphaerobolus stellatus SS14]|uniref:Unplaced genomic scaffold SPHSTscaffold_137, whole genome shotgun sequence n=1 Tax=Sphaerobolus stellatus (strain SS14) TaxID=990650 RepID=A0A0C9V853_SPHS4|nr:hypothetical protein M422DRAFT_264570 [Sphaerobolus stellatus SS14]